MSPMLARACLLTVLATATPMLTACWDPEPTIFYIVNETGEPVTVSGGGADRPVLQDDESTTYATNRCNSADLVAGLFRQNRGGSRDRKVVRKRLMAHPG
jgi:hypothetical protein